MKKARALSIFKLIINYLTQIKHFNRWFAFLLVITYCKVWANNYTIFIMTVAAPFSEWGAGRTL